MALVMEQGPELRLLPLLLFTRQKAPRSPDLALSREPDLETQRDPLGVIAHLVKKVITLILLIQF